MANLGEAFVQIVADTSRFAASATSGIKKGLDGVGREFNKTVDDMADRAEKRFRDVGKTLESTGKTLSKRVTAPIVGLGVAGVKTAMDFESSFAMIEGLVGVTGSELEVLREAALGLGPDFGRSAQEAADALFFITSAGLHGSEAIEVLEMSLKSSQVGLGDVSTIADLATSVINAYGSETMDAARATDTLTAAVREGKLEPAELSGAMGQVLPIASAMGVEFEEVGAAFAAMSRTGTPAAGAATQLRQIMTSLLKPTKQAEDALEEMGLSSAGLREQIKDDGLLSVLETLTEAFEDNEVGAEAVFGNVRALSGVVDLMGSNADGTRQIFENMADTTGMLDEAFGVTAQTARFQFDQAMQQIKMGVVEVGNVLMPIFTEQVLPMLQRLGDFIIRVADRFNQLSERSQRLVLAAVGLTAALGPVLIILGQVFKAVAILVKPIAAVIKVVAALTKGLLFIVKTVVPLLLKAFVAVIKGLVLLGKAILANPLFLIAALIIGIIAVIWYFRDEIIGAFKAAWDWVTERTQEFMDWISEGITKLVDGVVELFTSLRDRVQNLWQRLRDFLVGRVEQIRDRIVDGVQLMRDRFVGAVTAMAEGVKKPINRIINFFNGVIAGAEAMLNAVGSALRGLPSFTVPSWVPRFGGNQFRIPSFGPLSLPRIPQLATGGIVQGDTLARIGEAGREAVVPLDRDRDPLNIAGLLADLQPSRNVTVNVYGEVRPIDEERLATLLRRQELLEGVR